MAHKGRWGMSGGWGCCSAADSNDAVGFQAGRRAGVHFLVLEDGNLGFEQPIFASKFGDFRGGGECACDPLALYCRFEAVEFLDARFEVCFEVLVFFPEVAFNCSHPAFEALEHALNGFDGVEEGFAERRKHAGDDFDSGKMVID